MRAKQKRRDRQAARMRAPARRPPQQRRPARPRRGPARSPTWRERYRAVRLRLSGQIKRLTQRWGTGRRAAADKSAGTATLAPGRRARSRRRGRRHVVVWTLLGVFLVVGGAGGWLYYRTQATPGYWRANNRFLQRTPTRRLQHMAARMQHRLIQRVTGADAAVLTPADLAARAEQGGISEPKTVRLDLDRVNAWLATRFAKWLENQDRGVPASVGRMMLGVHEGKPVLAFAYYPGGRRRTSGETAKAGAEAGASGASPRIVSLVFDAEVLPGGRAKVRLAGLRLGTLPLPRAWVMDRVRAQLKARPLNAGRLVLRAVLQGEAFEPRWQIDRRAVRLMAIDVEQDHLALTFRHEPAKPEDEPSRVGSNSRTANEHE